MTALDYMKRQVEKHQMNLHFTHPNTPPEHIENIKKKIGYYEAAVAALERGE